MTTIAKLRFRLKVRAELQKADKQLLDITKEELKREYERRNKNKW